MEEPDTRRPRRRREEDPLAALRRLRPESEVLRAVLELLRRIPGVVAWRNNVGSMTGTSRIGRRWHVQFGFPGLSDILGFVGPHGRVLAVECKRPVGGEVSRHQQAFLDLVNGSGGIGIVARSCDDIVARLRAEGIL